MRGGFGGEQDVSEMSLLAIKEVVQHLQDEFGLEEDISKKISEAASEIRDEINEERRAIMQDFRSMSDDERQEAMEEIQDIVKELNTDAFKKVKAMLNKEQLKRLAELKMQRMGIAILQDGMFQDMLEFSAEQTEKIKSLQESLDKRRQQMMDDMRSQMQDGGDRQAMRETMTAMRETMTDLSEKLEQETMAVLTDDQRKKLEEMKGAKFEFPAPRQRRRPSDS